MKKILLISIVFLFTVFGITNCDKKISQQECSEGIFMASGGTQCPDLIKITKSANSGLPVNTTISFGIVANEKDTVAIANSFSKNTGWKDGDVIMFKIIKFSPDTAFRTEVCWGWSYNATIEYCK